MRPAARAIILHDVFGGRHLPGEVRIVGRQAVAAVGRLGQVERVTLLNPQTRRGFLWENEAGRGGNGRDL
jgi:hypothetical protein